MFRKVNSKTLMACGLAIAVSSAACNRDASKTDQARGHEGAPIALTGCLQKSGSLTTTYILTQVNEPSRSVGTSGTAPNPQQEQVREAKHAYRLDGNDDQLEHLVGKQVKLSGTIAENSDLNKPENRAPGADIDPGDLAKVDVVTITAVADACK